MTIEPDKRHVEIILKDLNLNGGKAKSVVTPGVKLTDQEIEKRKSMPCLPRESISVQKLSDASEFLIPG